MERFIRVLRDNITLVASKWVKLRSGSGSQKQMEKVFSMEPNNSPLFFFSWDSPFPINSTNTNQIVQPGTNCFSCDGLVYNPLKSQE